MKNTPEDYASMLLATAIISAAEIREESYSVFDNFYRKTLRESCELACASYPHLTEPVFLMLSTCWNDALDWANEVATIYQKRTELLKLARSTKTD